MPHEIDCTTGRPAMAYTGKPPWHGLGAKLRETASIEEWIREAGLDWAVKKSPVLYVVPGYMKAKLKCVNNRFVLYRDDTNAALYIGSDRYNIVQPREIIEFYRGILDYHDMVLDTAGSLYEGRRIWALARSKKDAGFSVDPRGEDRVECYVLLATSYDGTMATVAKFVSVRVVCANTLEAAIRSNGRPSVKVRHSSVFDAEKIKKTLGLSSKVWNDFKDDVVSLANMQVDDSVAENVVKSVLDIEMENPWENERFREVMEAFRRGPGAQLSTANGTAWGLLNAITYAIDHRNKSRSPDSRMDSVLFGRGANIKKKAFDMLLGRDGASRMNDQRTSSPGDRVSDIGLRLSFDGPEKSLFGPR